MRGAAPWALMGDNLFRLKDRKGADLALGMTEEEVMTSSSVIPSARSGALPVFSETGCRP